MKVYLHPIILSSGVDGSGTLVLEYIDFVCTILCSKISHSVILCEIHGEKGTFVLEDAAPISEIKFTDSHTKESEILSVAQEEKDMVYECMNIAEIIATNDDDRYEKLKNLSKIVLRVTEEARETEQYCIWSRRKCSLYKYRTNVVCFAYRVVKSL